MKLRHHLEDARAEHQRTLGNCQTHMAELNDRRNEMSKLSEESSQGRHSLQVANAQLATLKAQLDRAVDQKAQKKMLKVSAACPSQVGYGAGGCCGWVWLIDSASRMEDWPHGVATNQKGQGWDDRSGLETDILGQETQAAMGSRKIWLESNRY
jgi:hypothetical protein